MRSRHWESLHNKTSQLSVCLLLLLSACSSEEATYFPLEEGHWWEYQETLIIRDETFSQRRIIRNLSSIQRDQKNYYVQEVQGQTKNYYSVDQEGIVRHSLDQADDQKQLLIPLKADDSKNWTQASLLGVIESRTFAAQDRTLTRSKAISLNYTVIGYDEQVVVPAGRFTQCLKIKGIGSTTVKVDRGNAKAEVQIENTDWYALGVGLVKTERSEKSESPFLKNGRYSLELLETN